MKTNEDSISWGELANLTHATQVERFNWCSCEEQEEYPYADCPREERVMSNRKICEKYTLLR
jgi:hypothetical protein